MKRTIILLSGMLFMHFSYSQTTYDIRLNQEGFLPNTQKYAAVINSGAETFEVKTADLSQTVFSGNMEKEKFYESSGENIKMADFSNFSTPGQYVLEIEGLGTSVPFIIGNNVFMPLVKGTAKAFYFNRASMELEEQYAGIYARPSGHPDTAVVVLPSAASEGRPAGTIISTPYGWYDAGDYNKYVVNSGISTFTLLSAYESYPGFYDTLTWNIPESDNNIPDILDEALWNIKWLMTMQDTVDGGVYNKTTTANFQGFVMPHQATATRYVVAKGTAATLDFAALMAMTARIYKEYLPGLADEALRKALKAWEWARANPNVAFRNPGSQDGYPSVGTGGYGDSNFSDEFSWCATELYITTKDDTYYGEINLDNINYNIPGWGNVQTLGLLSLLTHKGNLTSMADTALAKQKLLELVDDEKNNTISSPYRIPGDYFGWGGNSSYANVGLLLLQAFNITGETSYFNAAISSFDYLMGKNATTYCFVTGFGTKSPQNTHHRPSGADGIPGAIPGFLAGGANPGNVADDCGASAYPSLLPAKAYADKECSYSTNEIAINWNAPMVHLAGAIQSIYLENFTDSLPSFFIKSTSKINLPFKGGFKIDFSFNTNINWALTTSEEWISLSDTIGLGNATISVFSNSNNPTQEPRNSTVYIYKGQSLVDSIAVSQNGKTKTFLLEAEDYTSMFGLQTESTADEGGGLNIGYVDNGDWAEYNVDIGYKGTYEVLFRHAGYACETDIIIDSMFAQTISFPATSGWQDWKEQTTELGLEEGLHHLRLNFNCSGLNLNYLQFEWLKEEIVIVGNKTIHGNNYHVYPVPANDKLIVQANEITTISLLSIEGKVLINKLFTNTQIAVVNISDIPAGMYVLKTKSKDGVFIKKIVIK